jgi:hypothetical protein
MEFIKTTIILISFSGLLIVVVCILLNKLRIIIR